MRKARSPGPASALPGKRKRRGGARRAHPKAGARHSAPCAGGHPRARARTAGGVCSVHRERAQAQKRARLWKVKATAHSGCLAPRTAHLSSQQLGRRNRSARMRPLVAQQARVALSVCAASRPHVHFSLPIVPPDAPHHERARIVAEVAARMPLSGALVGLLVAGRLRPVEMVLRQPRQARWFSPLPR